MLADETARLTDKLGLGGLFGREGGPQKVEHAMGLCRESLREAQPQIGVINYTLRLFGEHVIPHFQAKAGRRLWLRL